jgi:DNA-binding NarL/FixJ family response regulator
LLACPGHEGWETLRAILREGPLYQVVAEVMSGADGLAASVRLHPEAVLFCEDLPDISAVYFAREVRRLSPASALVLVGREPDRAVLVGLVEAELDAILPWRQVTPLGVFCRLMPVLQATAVVVTHRALAERAGRGEASGASEEQPPRLGPVELAILEGLAHGRKRPQIAKEQGLSERSMRRRVTEIEQKLGAHTVPEAVAHAAALGLLPKDRPT